jgi:hypothetical protein
MTIVHKALQWLDGNQDKPLEDLASPSSSTNAETDPSIEPVGLKEGEVTRSRICNEPGVVSDWNNKDSGADSPKINKIEEYQPLKCDSVFGYRCLGQRGIRSIAWKERISSLIEGGKLTPAEIQVLITCKGSDLHENLVNLESMVSKRSAETVVDNDQRSLSVTPGLDYPYREIHALLLQWQDDDLGVDCVITDLRQVFTVQFGFESACSFRIPSHRPFEALEQRLQDFKQQHSSEKNLLVVYYAGHGFLDLQNRMHWAARR